MTKLLKSISKIIESSGSDKITVFTQTLKIDGKLFMPDGRCDECHEDFITLEQAMVCRLSDYCTCNSEDCDCNDYICFKYDWLNLAIDDIVAFSIIR